MIDKIKKEKEVPPNAEKVGEEIKKFIESEINILRTNGKEEQAKFFLEKLEKVYSYSIDAYVGISERNGEVQARLFFETMQKIAFINGRLFVEGFERWKELTIDRQTFPSERQLIEVANALNAGMRVCALNKTNLILLQRFFPKALDLNHWNLWKISSYFDCEKRDLHPFTALSLLEFMYNHRNHSIDLSELIDMANRIPENASYVFRGEDKEAAKWLKDAFSRTKSNVYIVSEGDLNYYRTLASLLSEQPMGIEIGEKENFSTDGSTVYIPRMYDKFNSLEANKRVYRNVIYHEAEGHVKGNSFKVNLNDIELWKLGYMLDEKDNIIKKMNGEVVLGLDGKPFKVNTTMDLLWFFGGSMSLAKYVLNIVEDWRVDLRVVKNNPGYAAEYVKNNEDSLLFRPEPKDANNLNDVLEAFLQKLLCGKNNTTLSPQLEERVNNLLQIVYSRALQDAEDATQSFNATIDLVKQLEEWFGKETQRVVVLLPFRPSDAPHNINVPVYRSEKRETKTKQQTERESTFRPDWKRDTEEAEAGKGVFNEWDCNRNGYVLNVACAKKVRPNESKLPNVDPALEKRVSAIFTRIKPSDKRIVSRQSYGDLEADKLIEVAIDTFAGKQPNPNIFQRLIRNKRSVCFGILKDASGSTASRIDDRCVSDIEDEAMYLFAVAARIVGDPCALWAYNSSGKEHTKFYIIQDFGETRFAQIKPENSNRDGVAIRMATKELISRPEKNKILFIISDLQPADEGYEGKYAFEDTKKAIFEARKEGVRVFGIVVREEDDATKEEAKEMYGPGSFIIVSDVRKLPEKMQYLYSLLGGLDK